MTVKETWRDECPTCKAPPWHACRSLRSKRVTDTHKARVVARYGRW